MEEVFEYQNRNLQNWKVIPTSVLNLANVPLHFPATDNSFA